MDRSQSWLPLEHKMWRLCQEYPWLKGKHLVLMVSGGKDSMVMGFVFSRLASAMKWRLTIVHIHHGGEFSHRDQAALLVEDWSRKQKLPFVTQRSPIPLFKEAEMRTFRYQSVRQWIAQQETSADKVLMVTAHHLWDLFETRLIRLMRGVGPMGIRAIRELAPPFFRPFLSVTPHEITTYQKAMDVPFIEDPSNQDNRYLRNWLRHDWLVALDRRVTGASTRFAHSLSLLADALESDEPSSVTFFRQQALCRLDLRQFWPESLSVQRVLIARCFQKLQIPDYTQGQIFEVWKRVWENPENQDEWTCGGVVWQKKVPWLYARKRSPH